MKADELIGAELDAAVARIERIVTEPEWVDVTTFADLARGERRLVHGGPGRPPCYSTDWSQCGPIIERERIALEPQFVAMHGERADWWCAWFQPVGNDGSRFRQTGPTPLIAAMRSFVASRS